MALMVAASAAAAVCALVSRAVPWQGRQAAVSMAVGMLLLALPGVTVPVIAVAALWVLSAMIGTVGLRGRPEAAGCCHRAIGALAMTLCLLTGAAQGAGAAHTGHGVTVGLPLLSGAAVLAVTAWSVWAARASEAIGASVVLLRVEVWTMTAGLLLMWGWHVLV